MRGLVAASRVVIDGEIRDHAGPEALDDHIGVPREREKRIAATRVLEVQRRAALVAVDGAEERRHGARPIAQVSCIVAGAGVLDLDDVGAEVGEIERADRARQEAREVEHAKSREGSRA